MNEHKKEKSASAAAWLQVTAGQGPKECGWVVAQVNRLILEEASTNKIRCEIVESHPFDKSLRKQDLVEIDAYRSVVIQLEGRHLDEFCRGWLGTIKWRGQSPYRPAHKRINWFVAVERMAVVDTDRAVLSSVEAEISFEATRSRGPGGQHVNKTSSAVRATHIPTGLTVRVEANSSQHRNRKLAVERIHRLLVARQLEASEKQCRDRWLQHAEVARGNPDRVFLGPMFKEA